MIKKRNPSKDLTLTLRPLFILHNIQDVLSIIQSFLDEIDEKEYEEQFHNKHIIKEIMIIDKRNNDY